MNLNRLKTYQSSQSSDEHGMVSLMTAVIISILLVVIVISMIGLMLQEARQASDSNESIVAYYAADAGAEDALLAVKTALNTPGGMAALAANQSNCTTQTTANSNNSLYTCQRIVLNKNILTGTLDKEKSLQIDLGGLSLANCPCQLQISWNLSGSGGTNFNPPAFMTGSNWGANGYPAVMEESVVSYPIGGSFMPASVGYGEAVIRPSTGGGAGSNVSNNPVLGHCSAASTYNCSVTLSGFLPILDYVVRIRPRYVGTQYQVQYLDKFGRQIAIPDQYATIDVTAKSGNVYRRVIENVKIRAGALDGLDYVLFSDTNICKDYRVELTNALGTCPPP